MNSKKEKQIDIFEEFKKIGLNELRFKIHDFKNFEGKKVFVLKVTGKKASYIWWKLRCLREKTKYHPIITRDSIDYWLKGMRNIAPKDIQRKAEGINPKEFLVSHFKYWYKDAKIKDYMGSWPDEDDPLKYFIIPYESCYKTKQYIPLHRVDIVLLPIEQPWKSFSYIPYGYWNDCPSNEGHVAVMKYWYNKYQAEIGAISKDGSIEFYVENPPTTREEAYEISKEHFYYCFDRIAQAPHTIESLASRIINSNIWYFWWD